MSHLYLGSRVQFDYEGTTLTGEIIHFVSDISNARKNAVVKIEHQLPGITHTVPVDQLTPAPVSQNMVFMSGGNADYLCPNVGNRRFTVISVDSKRAS